MLVWDYFQRVDESTVCAAVSSWQQDGVYGIESESTRRLPLIYASVYRQTVKLSQPRRPACVGATVSSSG